MVPNQSDSCWLYLRPVTRHGLACKFPATAVATKSIQLTEASLTGFAAWNRHRASLAGFAAGDGHRARNHHGVVARLSGWTHFGGEIRGNSAGEDQGDDGNAKQKFHDVVTSIQNFWSTSVHPNKTEYSLPIA
jgi:hypothetical protein